MKILMIACTNDENGLHNPEEIVDMPEGAALDYINRGLALPHIEEAAERTAPKEQAAAAPHKEEATGKGQQAGHHAKPPEESKK